jgi:hypothetical protein
MPFKIKKENMFTTPWKTWQAIYARPYLELLKWAREHGCRWSEWAASW